MADTLKQAYRDLVIANRVLANQGVVDAYGVVQGKPGADNAPAARSARAAPR